jgi:hypothetical protein
MLARPSGVGSRARLCVGSSAEDHRARRGRRSALGIGARRCRVLDQTLGELGSDFRLGAVARQEGSLPDDLIVALHDSTLNGRHPPFPEQLGSILGDIVVALSYADFISFSPHWPNGRGLVAIRSIRSYPLTLPNVARNVIAHELGHAIGLAHNSDPTMLMCGRPAPCRPVAFQSATEHYFPLTGDEKALLLQLYPASWHTR